MLAYIPAILFGAVAAASAGSHENIFVRRAALSAMKVEEAGQTCEPSQTLVCCDQSEKCSEVDIGQINKSDFLYEHCTATVLCCNFDNQGAKIRGDVTQNCIYVGNLSG